MDDTGINRRGFATASLATGFALAVLPVSAQTIITDADDLDAGMVQVPVAGGATMAAYRAVPKRTGKGGHHPVVLVVQEIFGLHEHIRDLCRRLAKSGYYAIAPDLYFRQGDATKVPDIPTLIRDIVSKVSDAQVMADLDATVAHLKTDNRADTRRMAITGFCWGGRIVWLYSAHNPDLKAGAAWYGRLVGNTDADHPKNPIDLVDQLNAPVLGLYGAKDEGIPVASVDQMRTALAKGDKAADASKLMVFPESGHGFNADYRPSYNPVDAKIAWKQMLEWFKKHGVPYLPHT
ncbi:dienelactone hydrolase family protein [Nitrospirillum sp. BR 11752]|uniref:dienelactone hydrolase family protein n=1 Tax=Nitrospirillum sp. BR 11752 TaxID=3104293 RepID=UPI002E98B84C|nr:dienelactone hydrolase family protein [Nitrospirillum sp. BR 11752]